METNTEETPVVNVVNQPTLKDQALAAAVGAAATFVVTLTLTVGAEIVKVKLAERKTRKLAKKNQTTPTE